MQRHATCAPGERARTGFACPNPCSDSGRAGSRRQLATAAQFPPICHLRFADAGRSAARTAPIESGIAAKKGKEPRGIASSFAIFAFCCGHHSVLCPALHGIHWSTNPTSQQSRYPSLRYSSNPEPQYSSTSRNRSVHIHKRFLDRAVACWTRQGPDGVDAQGGLLRTDDGGATWKRVFDERIRVNAAAVSPTNPDVIFINTFQNAAFRSDDRGRTWKRLEGYRFKWGQRPNINPPEPGAIYLTTYGGSVFYGPAEGVPGATGDIVNMPSAWW